MSEAPEDNDNTPEEGEAKAKEPTTPTQAPTPSIDVDELARQVAEQASKSVQGTITAQAAKEIAAKLDPDRGSSKKPHPLIEELLMDPEGFVSTLSQMTREATTEDIKKAQTQERNDTAKLRELSEEYPEVVKENLDFVDSMFTQVSSDPAFKGKSRNEIIEEAVKRTAKRLKVKPVSERSQDDNYRNSMFPGVGSSSTGTSSTGTDSAFDYIKGRREAMQKLKGRG